MDSNNIISLKKILSTVMPNAKVCLNCEHARRWAGDKDGTTEYQGCGLYSQSTAGLKEDDGALPSIEDAPEGASLGWVDLKTRPGCKSSGFIINNCVIVKIDSTCKNFKKS